MPIQPAYTSGTVTVTQGSAVVSGNGTGWGIGLVNGGLFTFQGVGIPIASVESDTSLTLVYPWPYGSNSGAYAVDLGRAEAASAIVANRRLAEFLAQLGEMSALGSQLTAAETEAAVRELIRAQEELGYVPQRELGYTPVRAETPEGEGTNRIRQWWDGGRLRAQVDNADLGEIVTSQGGEFSLGAGLTLAAALKYGLAAVDDPLDLSRHIALYGSTYGLSVSSGMLNLIAGGGGQSVNVLGNLLERGSRVWSGTPVAQSFGANGYIQFPNGGIVQAGASGGGDRDIIFPTVFPNACIAVVPTAYYATTSQTETTSVFVSAIARSAFTVRPRFVNNGGGVGATAAYIINWIAFGY